MTLIERARGWFPEHLLARRLLHDPVAVRARVLSSGEAVGQPGLSDIALLREREVMVEATFRGARGHAFTDAPSDWSGTLNDAPALSLDGSHNRALLPAIINAVLLESGVALRTLERVAVVRRGYSPRS